jgi:hypothetical protein
MVEIQFSQKNGDPLSLIAKHKDPNMMEVLDRNFSHQCFVCINYEKELVKIKAYLTTF